MIAVSKDNCEVTLQIQRTDAKARRRRGYFLSTGLFFKPRMRQKRVAPSVSLGLIRYRLLSREHGERFCRHIRGFISSMYFPTGSRLWLPAFAAFAAQKKLSCTHKIFSAFAQRTLRLCGLFFSSISSSLHGEWSFLVQSLRSHLSELDPNSYLFSPPPPPKKACILYLESYPEPVINLLQKITLAIQSKGGQATLLPLSKITSEFSIFIGEKPLLSQTPSPSTHILIPDLNEQLTNKEAKMRLWKEIQTVLELK